MLSEEELWGSGEGRRENVCWEEEGGLNTFFRGRNSHQVILFFHPAAKGDWRKESGEKLDEKGDRSASRESDQS